MPVSVVVVDADPGLLLVYEHRIQLSNTEKTPAWPSGLCIRRGELSEGSGFDSGKILLNSWGFQATHRGGEGFCFCYGLQTLNLTCLFITVEG